MPDYVYRDGAGHERGISHRMLYTTAVFCLECEQVMHRVPQLAAIVWGGLPPSKGEIHPDIKAFIDGAPERRAAKENEHEQ